MRANVLEESAAKKPKIIYEKNHGIFLGIPHTKQKKYKIASSCNFYKQQKCQNIMATKATTKKRKRVERNQTVTKHQLGNSIPEPIFQNQDFWRLKIAIALSRNSEIK